MYTVWSYYWLGKMLPFSTLVEEDALAPNTVDPALVPPMTIIVLLFSKATPALLLALVSESTFLHICIDSSYRVTSDEETPLISPPMVTSGLE